MHFWKMKPGLRKMNSLMRLITKYFHLRGRYHAGWRMLKKRTSQTDHLEAAEANHQKCQKDQRHRRNKDLLGDQNHPNRRSLKTKSGLASSSRSRATRTKTNNLMWSTETEHKGRISEGKSRSLCIRWSETHQSWRSHHT